MINGEMINRKHLEQYLTWAKHFQETQRAFQHVGPDPVSPSCLFGLLVVFCRWPAVFKQGDQAGVALRDQFSEGGVSGSVWCFCKREKTKRFLSVN